MHSGSTDFLNSQTDELLHQSLKQVLEDLERVALNDSCEHETRFVFASEVMREINFKITRLARLSFDVLLIGETGVGKDMVASEIHRRSSRSQQPFIQLPLRTLSEGLIESELFGHEKGSFSGAETRKIGKIEAAEKGTLYIPEISSLSETMQLKLLQFMQYRTYSRVGQDPRIHDVRLDVRIIMATNENLDEVVRSGRMREDFFHRINGVNLVIPPLRERTEDIKPLAASFVRKHLGITDGTTKELSPEVMSAFRSHAWPGNVRQLENYIKGGLAYSNGPTLVLEDFHSLTEARQNHLHARNGNNPSDEMSDFAAAEQEFRLEYFSELMKHTDNSITRAAAIAKLTPQGLRKILATLGLGLRSSSI